MKNPCFALLWLLLLIFIAWPISFFVSFLWIILLPFEPIFGFIRDANACLEDIVMWPRTVGQAIIDCSSVCPQPWKWLLWQHIFSEKFVVWPLLALRKSIFHSTALLVDFLALDDSWISLQKLPKLHYAATFQSYSRKTPLSYRNCVVRAHKLKLLISHF